MADDDLCLATRWEARLRRHGLATFAAVLERAERVRDLPGRANLVVRLENVTLFVKWQKHRGWTARTRNRELTGMVLARLADVPVPTVVLAGEDARYGALTATLDLAPARPLDDLLSEGRLRGGVRREVAASLARATGALHDHGLHHRDLYLNHVYVDPQREDALVAIIDWDRCGRHRAPLGRRVVKDLAALWSSVPRDTVTEREGLSFLVRYLRGRGLGGGRRARRLARCIGRKAARIRAHVPRTPVGEAARRAAAGEGP